MSSDSPDEEPVESQSPCRRRWKRVAAVVAAGMFLAVAWLVVTGLLARAQLEQASSGITQLRGQVIAGKMSAARQTATQIRMRTHRAHQLTNLPGWALAARLPEVGAPMRAVRGIAASTDTLMTSALPALIEMSTNLNPTTLRGPGGRIALNRLSAAGPAIAQAATGVTRSANSVRKLPHPWFSPVNNARRDLLAQLVSLDGDLATANRVVEILPQMLGQNGPKRYFVAFQNESEARGTGGVAGAFAILRADRGQITFERFETDALTGVRTNVTFGPDYAQLYNGDNTTFLYGNANVSPNFPYAAQIWAAMWEKHSGEHVDGTLAIDPTVLSYLLAVTGPASMPDGTQVSAANVVALSENTVYTKFATNLAARRAYLVAIAQAASTKVLSAGADTQGLVAALAHASRERRLLVWSADPAIEAKLEPTAVSGVIPRTSAPYVGLSLVNSGGNKLDYYLARSLTWQRTGCGPTRAVTVTITLTNNAPTGLPAYVIGRSDVHSFPVRPGDNRLQVAYSATDGALMNSVTVNGKSATASIGAERGHPVYLIDVELPRATSRSVVLHLTEPAATGTPVVLQQPLVHPLKVGLKDLSCG